MYARQTTGQFDPAKLDEGIRLFREHVIPAMRQQGAKGGRLLVDRRSGKVHAVSLWESAAAAEAAQAVMNQQREQVAQQTGARNMTTEVFEVAVYEDF